MGRISIDSVSPVQEEIYMADGEVYITRYADVRDRDGDLLTTTDAILHGGFALERMLNNGDTRGLHYRHMSPEELCARGIQLFEDILFDRSLPEALQRQYFDQVSQSEIQRVLFVYEVRRSR